MRGELWHISGLFKLAKDHGITEAIIVPASAKFKYKIKENAVIEWVYQYPDGGAVTLKRACQVIKF